MLALLDALGIERCLLVGHSMGGAIAQQLTLDQPQRVRRLVVANSMPMFKPQTRRHFAEFASRWVVMGLLGPARPARNGAQRLYSGADQAEQRSKSATRGAATVSHSH